MHVACLVGEIQYMLDGKNGKPETKDVPERNSFLSTSARGGLKLIRLRFGTGGAATCHSTRILS